MLEFGETVMAIPAPSKEAFVPVARRELHKKSLYNETLTVSAELRPIIFGVVLVVLGELGLVEEKVGSLGPALS